MPDYDDLKMDLVEMTVKPGGRFLVPMAMLKELLQEAESKATFEEGVEVFRRFINGLVEGRITPYQ